MSGSTRPEDEVLSLGSAAVNGEQIVPISWMRLRIGTERHDGDGENGTMLSARMVPVDRRIRTMMNDQVNKSGRLCPFGNRRDRIRRLLDSDRM